MYRFDNITVYKNSKGNFTKDKIKLLHCVDEKRNLKAAATDSLHFMTEFTDNWSQEFQIGYKDVTWFRDLN